MNGFLTELSQDEWDILTDTSEENPKEFEQLSEEVLNRLWDQQFKRIPFFHGGHIE